MNRITAVFSLPDVLRQGKLIANPESWKRGQITASILAALILSLLNLSKVFGVDIPISEDQIHSISAGIVAVIGIFVPVLTVVTTDKIGLKPKQ